MSSEPVQDNETARVEQLLHQAACWTPTRDAPDDLCVRVAGRIAGKATARSHRYTALAPYGMVASAVMVFAAFAVFLPGRVPQAPPTSAGVWQPPRPSRSGADASHGTGLMRAAYQEPDGQIALTAPAAGVWRAARTEKAEQKRAARKSPQFRPGKRRLKPAHPPFRRTERWYASRAHRRQRDTARQLPLPSAAATDGWQPDQDDLIAYVPVVLAEYETEPETGQVRETFTPAIVAVSLKPDGYVSPPTEPRLALSPFEEPNKPDTEATPLPRERSDEK